MHFSRRDEHMSDTQEINSGLEGVVVAETSLSMIDGQNGILRYRGYDIDDLAQTTSFEEIMHLLWFGTLPNQSQLDDLKSRLRSHRQISPAVKSVLSSLPTTGAPIDAMRAATTAMAMEDPDERSLDPDDIQERAIRMAAAFPTMLAAYIRLRKGENIVEPHKELGEAANFLYMMTGEEPTELQANAFNCYLILVAEHSMNASTFSGRVTFSTITDLYSAVSAALGCLKGDAHGGANARAMEMLLDIGTKENVEPYVEESLQIKRRLMGIGHRVYRARDPRAKHLMGFSESVAEQKGDRTWHDVAVRLEDMTNEHPFFTERKLYPNVEFYSAPLLYSLGIPIDAMPAAFAISRIVGWTANLNEQLPGMRLIRPQARYTGPETAEFKPIDQRG
jgi:citrate synthase